MAELEPEELMCCTGSGIHVRVIATDCSRPEMQVTKQQCTRLAFKEGPWLFQGGDTGLEEARSRLVPYKCAPK